MTFHYRQLLAEFRRNAALQAAVSQVLNLLRGGNAGERFGITLCRLQTGDTAGCNPALRK